MTNKNLATLKRIHYNYILQFRYENQISLEILKSKKDFSISDLVLINEKKLYDQELKAELIELDTEINKLCMV